MKGYVDLDDKHDLVYSRYDEDETGKGFYIQRFPDQKTSQLFESARDATKALAENKLKFD